MRTLNIWFNCEIIRILIDFLEWYFNTTSWDWYVWFYYLEMCWISSQDYNLFTKYCNLFWVKIIRIVPNKGKRNINKTIIRGGLISRLGDPELDPSLLPLHLFLNLETQILEPWTPTQATGASEGATVETATLAAVAVVFGDNRTQTRFPCAGCEKKGESGRETGTGDDSRWLTATMAGWIPVTQLEQASSRSSAGKGRENQTAVAAWTRNPSLTRPNEPI